MKEVRRQEYKYMISYKDYFMIIDMIKAMLIHDKHGDSDSYPVHSIYLDDIYFSGAMVKLLEMKSIRNFEFDIMIITMKKN